MEGQFTGKSLSAIVGRMVPEFVSEDHQQFTVFLQKYFEYLEQDLNAYDLLANALLYADIDETVDQFIEQFRKQYTDDIPRKYSFLDSSVDIKGDIRLIIKKIRDYYLSKGSELSYKFIFNIIYGVDVTFYYPKVDILRCSDGKWSAPNYIVLDGVPDLTSYDDVYIVGTTSGATGYVDVPITIKYPLLSATDRIVLSVEDTTGAFVIGETISVVGSVETPLLIEDYIVGQGSWTGTDGFLSSNKFIQDNFYYQDFSYELQSTLPIELYESVITKMLHPAGLKLFGKAIASSVVYMDKPFTLNNRFNIEWANDTSTIFAPVDIAGEAVSLDLAINTIDVGINYVNDLDILTLVRFDVLSMSVDYNTDIERLPIVATITLADTVLPEIVMEDLLPRADDVSYSYVEVNKELGYYNTMTIADMSGITLGEWLGNSEDNGTLVFVEGTKITGYDILNDVITLPSAYSSLDVLDVYDLSRQTRKKQEFVGDGTTATFALAADAKNTVHNVMAFVDGIKFKTTLSGNNLTFSDSTPINNSTIHVFTEHNINDSVYYSGDGSTTEFAISQPFRDGRLSLLVFVDGKFTNDYYISNDNIVFRTVPQVSINNINILYVEGVSGTQESHILDGTALSYKLNNTPNIFRYMPSAISVITTNP